MTNLLILHPDVPFNATRFRTNRTFDTDRPITNLISPRRESLAQLASSSSAWLEYEFDCGTDENGDDETKASNFLYLAKANLMQSSISQVTLRGSSESMFCPSDISGLTAWYDANQGITKDGSDLVSQWDDLSGNGYHMTQSSTKRPLWKAPSAGVNDNCAILFDGSNDCMSNDALGALFTGGDLPYSLAVVAKANSTSAGDTIFAFGSTTTNALMGTAFRSTNICCWRIDDAVATVNVTFGTPNTSTRVVTTSVTGTAASAWLDGTLVANGTSQNVGAQTLNSSRIGALLAVGAEVEQFDGYICEVIVYNRAITTDEATTLNNYLTSKWQTSAVFKQASFPSATLYGPSDDDFVTTFTTSSSYRYWWLNFYPSTSTKFPHSKCMVGSYLDLSQDCHEYAPKIVLNENDEWFSSSNSSHASRVQRPRFRYSLAWEGVSDDKVTEFANYIAADSHRSSLALYTSANHGILENNRVVHCKLNSWSSSRTSRKGDWNQIKAEFDELL